MKNFLHINWFWFGTFVLTGCGLSAALQFELWWDFANYHYYNPWAFLNRRMGFDIAPASVNTYFNPFLDLPFYYLVHFFNDHPRLVSSIQGAWWGALLFVFYKINLLLWEVNSLKGKFSVLLSLAIGATGFATFMQMGTSSNEVQTAFFILSGFYLLFNEICGSSEQRTAVVFSAGLIMGAAMGLKPTAIVYCLGAGSTLLLYCRQLKSPLQSVLGFVGGGLLGYLLTNGYWMFKLWKQFGNPFFPFLNAVFKSPYFDDFNYTDRRYLPEQWYDYLIYPFEWAFHFRRIVGETCFVDIRIALLSVIALMWLVLRAVNKCPAMGIRLQFMATFVLVSYILWLSFFAIIRYLIPVEMLAAIFIVKGFWGGMPSAGRRQTIYLSAAVFLGYMLVNTPLQSSNFGSRRKFSKVIDAEKMFLPNDTLILLYNFPTAALIPIYVGENPKIRAIGMKHHNGEFMKGSDFSDRGAMAEQKEEVLRHHQGPVVVFVRNVQNFYKVFNPKTDRYVKKMFCRPLKTNIDRLIDVCVPENLRNSIFAEEASK